MGQNELYEDIMLHLWPSECECFTFFLTFICDEKIKKTPPLQHFDEREHHEPLLQITCA